ncbi:hypothetical protein ACFX2B_014063 [Malus domestica]
MGGEDGGNVWINENRFKIVRQLGEGGFAYVYLVKEVVADSSSSSGGGLTEKFKDPSHVSGTKISEGCLWISCKHNYEMF